MMLPTDVIIHEGSNVARMAAWFLKSGKVAMVWGNRILLWGASATEFQQNTRWVRHELKHVEQFKRLGITRFILLYLWNWILHGYQNNQFEIEARKAEEIPHPIAG